jgi:hypothetical protein
MNQLKDVKNIKEILYYSGDLFLPTPLMKFLRLHIIGDATTTFYISNWSIVHFLSGFFFGFLIKTYLIDKTPYKTFWHVNNYYIKLFSLHSAWELWQIFIENSDPFTFKEHGNIVDIFMDTVLFMIGGYLYKTYSGF